MPSASADRVEGVVQLGDGRRVLKLRVSAVPDKGKANAAVVKLLAKSWGVPRSSLAVVSGEKDRNKTVLLEGVPLERLAFLENWFAQL